MEPTNSRLSEPHLIGMSTMSAPPVFERPAQYEPEIHDADTLDQTCLENDDTTGNSLLPAIERSPGALVNIIYSEPLSSSPSTSPTTFALSRTGPDTDNTTQDSEPVPFSSTPDLGSRETSSSPNAGYDSPALITPPGDKFILTLDRKLQELVNANHGHQSATNFSLDNSQDENSSQVPRSVTSADEYDTTPSSTHSNQSRLSLKRKRSLPRACDTPIDADSVDDEDSDEENKDTGACLSASVLKKLKETSFNYVATETASARRARSLSVCSSHSSFVPTERDSPSRPSTPVYKTPAVPIIAPPDFEAIPRPPLTSDDASEVRLRVLLTKEGILRRREGLEKGIDDIHGNLITKEQVDGLLGIDENFRKEVIGWMLRVTPSKKLDVGELRHQLRTCPETRFHAILLFTRYFMRVGDAMPIATERETPLMRLGRKRITWDVAMSCLALAIKFNRDFLSPLNPVYSREFLVLAPHPMSHDDFEVSQKDVLQALDYEIRDITPGPFMQEIWGSLSSLRKLLSFPDGWEVSQVNAWHILNASASTSEMLQFPTSLLTAAAIIEGAVVALMDLCEHDAEGSDADRAAREEADSMIADAVKDITELMAISSTDMKRCRRWLRKIIRSTY